MHNFENLERLMGHSFNPTNVKNAIQDMGWKTSRFVNFGKKGLLFNVDARHHKGSIFITATCDGDYNVYILNQKLLIIDEIEGISGDSLIYMIDKRIEKDSVLRF